MRNKILLLLFICLTLGCSPEKTIRVACVGDSITYGSGISNQVRDSYPAVLGQMLGEDYEVRNFGYSARTLMNKGDRPYMKDYKYPQALEFNPDIVVIKMGTNDTKPMNWPHHEDFTKDLTAMIDSFKKQNSETQIFLCLPVPAYHLSWGINDSIIVHGVIPYIKEVASEQGLPTINLYEPFSNCPELFSDGIHPTAEGAQKMAAIIYEYISGKKLEETFVKDEYPGVKRQYRTHSSYDFTYKNCRTRILLPKEPSSDSRWITRQGIYDKLADEDKAALKSGCRIALIDSSDDEIVKDFSDYLQEFYPL